MSTRDDVSIARSVRSRFRRAVGKFVPNHFPDPVGFVRRTLRDGEQEARSALVYAGLGLVASPLDLALSVFDRGRARAAIPGDHPLIFVVGPPRSGTTVVYQALVRALPVSYFNNLTSVFPRSPLTVSRLATRPFRNAQVGLTSYYGRTSSWWAPNDGLYLWDRWFDGDRTSPRNEVSPEQAEAMSQFFGAWTAVFDKPLVNKNNSLETAAHVVAAALPRAHFICLSRDPVFLAQSLLRARRDLYGDMAIPYGVDPPARHRDSDPVMDVCYQVEWHAATAARQQTLIGADRFWVVSYEDFCARPADLVGKVASEVLGLDLEPNRLAEIIPSVVLGNRQKLPDGEFERITLEVERLGLNG